MEQTRVVAQIETRWWADRPISGMAVKRPCSAPADPPSRAPQARRSRHKVKRAAQSAARPWLSLLMIFAKYLSFHKYRGTRNISTCVFINIVGSSNADLLFSITSWDEPLILNSPLFPALGLDPVDKCFALNKIGFRGNSSNFAQVLAFSYTSWDTGRSFPACTLVDADKSPRRIEVSREGRGFSPAVANGKSSWGFSL